MKYPENSKEYKIIPKKYEDYTDKVEIDYSRKRLTYKERLNLEYLFQVDLLPPAQKEYMVNIKPTHLEHVTTKSKSYLVISTGGVLCIWINENSVPKSMERKYVKRLE